MTIPSLMIGALALPFLSAVLAAQEAQPRPAMPIRTMPAQGQAAPKPPSQDDLKERFEAKLKKPFLSAAPWITDYDAAKKDALESGKLIFGYFTRSYAP